MTALLLGAVGCGTGSGSPSPDCARIDTLAHADGPVPAGVPVPDGVADARATVIPAQPGVEIPAGQSTLAMPDPDVPRTVVAGKVSGDLGELRSAVERDITGRGWRVEPGSTGAGFTLGYRGPGVSGSVVAMACGYLATQETSPPLPTGEGLPACAKLAFPAEVYPATIVANATDDGPNRTCEFRDRAGDSLSSRTTVVITRPPVDPHDWRRRLENLRRSAADYLKQGCAVKANPTASPEIFASASV
ncbi:MAG TPA: hypothetical protein VM677_17835, partial [Actinokineospora sp.]|nr:hypothetical protein [Actinokineospora sp.]